MRKCMQFGTLNVLEHGHLVTEAFATLLEAFKASVAPAGWRIPPWLFRDQVLFTARLLDASTLYDYQRYHDCGKPFCRAVDAQGKVHFHGHAEHSERAWLAAGGCIATGRLIGLDMTMHLASAEDMLALSQLPEAASLYLTAVAEVHANAEMFGGFCSPSFLSKMKHLDRRGRALGRQLLQGRPIAA